MNKKGVIGKVLTMFFVMVLLALIMSTFVWYSIQASVFKGFDMEDASKIRIPENFILLEDVSITVGEEVKDMRVIDAMLLVEKNELDRVVLEEELKTFLDENKNCLVITLNGQQNTMFFGYKRIVSETGLVDFFVADPNEYRDRDLLYTVDLILEDNNLVGLEYYYGGCLNE